jgi:hypothetical protein
MNSTSNVIAGLDPAIQLKRETRCIHQAFLNRRVKPGDDSLEWMLPCAINPFLRVSASLRSTFP